MSSGEAKLEECLTCNGKGKNTRGQRCLDCNGTGKIKSQNSDEEHQCSHCFHDNFTSPPLDDLEAACDCDCHDSIEYDDEDEDFVDDYAGVADEMEETCQQ